MYSRVITRGFGLPLETEWRLFEIIVTGHSGWTQAMGVHFTDLVALWRIRKYIYDQVICVALNLNLLMCIICAYVR